MRVVHVAHWPRTGITSVMRDLGRALRGRVTATFVELCGDEGGPDYYGTGGEYVGLDFGRHRVASLRALRGVLRRSAPDIVHTHSLQPFLWSAALGSGTVPLVHAVHSDYPYLTNGGPRNLLKRSLLRTALWRFRPQVVAVSPRVAEVLAGQVPDPAWPVVIEPGFETLPRESLPELRRRARASLDLGPGDRLLVAVGRLHPEKGYDVLIDAIARLASGRPELRLLIIGEGDARPDLETRIARHRMAGRITLAGYLPAPLEIVAGADLFVLSSRYEGWGIALAEAVSCEVPAVATPVGIAPRVLGERYARFLARGLDVDALTVALEAALAPEVDLRQAGRDMADFVRSEFSLQKFGQRHLELYESLLRGEAC